MDDEELLDENESLDDDDNPIINDDDEPLYYDGVDDIMSDEEALINQDDGLYEESEENSDDSTIYRGDSTPYMPSSTQETNEATENNTAKLYYIFSDNIKKAKAVHSLQIIDDADDIVLLSDSESDESNTIDFSGRNTWNNYRLISSSRPIINPPDFRSSFIEIPGMDGLMDVSTLLTGGNPLYGRRKGDIEFYVTRDYNKYYTWAKAYSNIMSFLHGQMVKCILMDDPSFYYRGRMTVNQWRSEKDWSKIVLNYDFEPYKYSVFSSADKWLWDPFDFAEGIIIDPVNYVGENGSGIEVNSDQEKEFLIGAGSMKIEPTIVITHISTDNLKLSFKVYRMDGNNEVYVGETTRTILKKGGEITTTFILYGFDIKNGTYKLKVKQVSSISKYYIKVIYRYGSL